MPAQSGPADNDGGRGDHDRGHHNHVRPAISTRTAMLERAAAPGGQRHFRRSGAGRGRCYRKGLRIKGCEGKQHGECGDRSSHLLGFPLFGAGCPRQILARWARSAVMAINFLGISIPNQDAPALHLGQLFATLFYVVPNPDGAATRCAVCRPARSNALSRPPAPGADSPHFLAARLYTGGRTGRWNRCGGSSRTS